MINQEGTNTHTRGYCDYYTKLANSVIIQINLSVRKSFLLLLMNKLAAIFRFTRKTLSTYYMGGLVLMVISTKK